jgi:hypothetical protein
MKLREMLKSPVFPLGYRWQFERRKDGYESDITALVRSMQQDERIRQDQRFAWDRWRAEDTLSPK